MSDKIIIDLKTNLLENKNIQFLNNDNECVICLQELEDDKDLVIINNLCDCYKICKICKPCLVSWINENKKCIVCRKEFTHDNIDIERVNNELYYKYDYKVINIYDDDTPDDIVHFLRTNQFTTFRTFKMWFEMNKCKILKYTFCYTFIGMTLYTFNESIKYQREHYNQTHTFII